MFPHIRNPQWHLMGITLAALLSLFFWTPASSSEALDGTEGNRQAIGDIDGRPDSGAMQLDTTVSGLDTLSAQLQQNNEVLNEQESRLEDNSIKLYETLIGIDSIRKELTLLHRAHERMQSVQAETTARDITGGGDNNRLGLLLPLVLCLLLPLAVAIDRKDPLATPSDSTSGAKPVAGVLIAWFAGGAGFFLIGIGILYGTSLGGVIGNPAHFLGALMLSAPADIPPELLERLVPHLILASIVAVVASSAAPRDLTHRGHFLVAVVAGALLYPLIGHWIATPTDISEHSGWLAGSAVSCSAATTNVALLGGTLALSLSSGLGLIRPSPASPLPVSAGTTTTGGMLLWIAWTGVILIANTDCLPITALLLSLAATAGGAVLGAILADGATTRAHQWQGRLPFAVLAGIVAAPVSGQAPSILGLTALGALTGVFASLLMRFFDTRSTADNRLASALLVGGLFGALAQVISSQAGFAFIHSIDVLAPQAAVLLLGLVAGRVLAWPINSTRALRTPA